MPYHYAPIAGAAFGAVFFVIFIFAFIILWFVGMIWAIIDIIRAKNEGDNWKVIWILVVVLLGIIGVGRKDRIPPEGRTPPAPPKRAAKSNPKAVKYIKQQRAEGYTTSEIRQALKEAGYTSEEIEASLKQAKGG